MGQRTTPYKCFGDARAAGVQSQATQWTDAAGYRRKKCSLFNSLNSGTQGISTMKMGVFLTKPDNTTIALHHMILRHLFRLIGGGAFSPPGRIFAARRNPSAWFHRDPVASAPNATAMAFSPDGRLFVCQQGGALRVISGGTLLPTPFTTVTTTAIGRARASGSHFRSEFCHQPVCLRLLHGSHSTDPQSRQPFHREHREPRRRGSRERDGDC